MNSTVPTNSLNTRNFIPSPEDFEGIFFAGEGLARLVNQSDSHIGITDSFVLFKMVGFFAGPYQNKRLLLS